ncbi:MerR family transcriptional regulator [Streptomyces sp. NPDC020801]|uniref:MerR family transcriptional regulator n=1 Tax=unclassified Streptomyces TaxID=2593676 RepID=UPI00379A565C
MSEFQAHPGPGGGAAPAALIPGTGLTTGALARRLGVSPTTLRSWDRRYGIGPAVRDDGRHRRWAPRDVAMLETMCRLTSAGVPPAEAARAAKAGARDAGAAGAGRSRSGPAPARSPGGTGVPGGAGSPDGGDGAAGAGRPGNTTRGGDGGGPGPAPGMAGGRPPAREPAPPRASHAAGGLPLGDVRQECRGLARAAVRLDAPAVEEQLATAVQKHGLVVAWQEVMVPTLHAVGRKWASSGDRYVEVEHMLSWQVSTTLRRCAPVLAAPDGSPARSAGAGPVMLACVPGEEHTLPLEALNAALGELGLPTRMFGAAVPAEALVAAVQRLGPVAVVLWAQARSTASVPLARHVGATQWGVKGARRRPLVVLGGPGWSGRSARGMVRPGGLREALDVLSALHATDGPR